MNRIETIALTNFKGASKQYDLGPVTMIVSPNETGKTRILQAIRAVAKDSLLDPRGGVLPGNDLCSGFPAAVRALHGGVWSSRSWLKDTRTNVFEGPPLNMPAVLLDDREYFGLTGPKRTAMIISVGGLGSITKESVISEVAGLKPDESSEAWETGLAEVLKTLRAPSTLPLNEWLSKNLTAIGTQKSQANAAAKQMAQTLQGLANLDELYPVEGDQAAAEAAIVEGQNRLQELHARRGALTAKQQEAARFATMAQSITGREAHAKQLETEIESSQALLDGLRQQLASMRTAEAITSEIAAQREAIDLIVGTAGVLAAENDRIESELDHLREHASCPSCGQPVPNRDSKISELEAALKTSIHSRSEKDKALAEAKEKDKALADERKAREAVVLRIDKITTSITNGQSAIQQAQLAITNFRTLAQPVAPGQDEVLLVQSQISDLNLTMTANRQIVAKFGSRRAEEERRQQAVVQCNIARATDAACGAALKALKAIQEKAVDGVFQTLIQTARRFTDGIMEHKLEFRDGEIGAVVGGRWVTHNTFSGLQQATTYIGVCAALCKPEERILMMDEMGSKIDKHNLPLFLDRIVELMLAGEINQFIGVDTDMEPYQACKNINAISFLTP